MLLDFLIKVDDLFLYICSLALIASFIMFKEFHSHTLTSLIVFTSESISEKIHTPLLNLTLASGVNEGRLIWYGTWMIMAFIVVWLLYKGHEWLNISSSPVSDKIGKFFIAYASLQTLGYADSFFFKSELIDCVYRYGIASVTVSVTLVLFWELLREKANGRVVGHYSDG